MNGRPRRRIGIVANSFTSGRGDLSGGFIHALSVAAQWPNVDVVVFAPEEARRAVHATLPAAHFVSAPPTTASMPRRFQAYVVIALRLCGTFFVRKEIAACDVVVATTAFVSDVFPIVFARHGRGAIIIQHLQTPPWRRVGNTAGNLAAFATERLGLALARRWARLVFVNDERVAVRANIPGDIAVVRITHGVDHVHPYARGASGASRSGALFVGRLHPTKGLDELLQSWQHVVRSRPQSALRIVGTGTAEYRAHLERRRAALGLDDVVTFLGAVDEAEKCRELASASAFVFPSLEEGWGIAIAEAMAFGTPVVTYDLEAYQEVFVRGRIVVRPHDVVDFAAATIRLLDGGETWQRLSDEAASLAKRFTWQHAGRIYERAFDRLLSDRSAL